MTCLYIKLLRGGILSGHDFYNYTDLKERWIRRKLKNILITISVGSKPKCDILKGEEQPPGI